MTIQSKVSVCLSLNNYFYQINAAYLLINTTLSIVQDESDNKKSENSTYLQPKRRWCRRRKTADRLARWVSASPNLSSNTSLWLHFLTHSIHSRKPNNESFLMLHDTNSDAHLIGFQLTISWSRCLRRLQNLDSEFLRASHETRDSQFKSHVWIYDVIRCLQVV